MNKQREIEVLEFKISELETKIENFEKFNISERKIDNLQFLKLRYEDQLTELELK